ncbi:MAG: pyruvate kinase alpha/beta domain-containing protein [Candidatus Aminicenantia bacterium]
MTVYFEREGAINTDSTLRLAKERTFELGIKNIVVASTSGRTGVKASEIFKGLNLIVVSHSTGFAGKNVQEMLQGNREIIEKNGGKVLTTTHAFGGVGRAVRRKFKTYEIEEIIANTLRVFGEGTKVAIEISLMAADAGFIKVEEETISIAGTDYGADTALILLPVNAQDFFDLKVLELICKPRNW